MLSMLSPRSPAMNFDMVPWSIPVCCQMLYLDSPHRSTAFRSSSLRLSRCFFIGVGMLSCYSLLGLSPSIKTCGPSSVGTTRTHIDTMLAKAGGWQWPQR